ncbi:hypothetical protein ACLBOM_36605 [Escherichia coli]
MNKNVFQTGIRLSLCAAIPGCLLWPLSGLALTVNVNSSAPITQQVAPELRKANQTIMSSARRRIRLAQPLTPTVTNWRP